MIHDLLAHLAKQMMNLHESINQTSKASATFEVSVDLFRAAYLGQKNRSQL